MSESQDLHPTFQQLSAALRELHRDLLMREAKKLEGERGQPLGPYELLNASLNDPSLAWLRRMSALIVNIDTLLDETPQLSGQEATRVADEVLTMLEKPAPQTAPEFWDHYSQYLHHDADIIMKHARVKDLLSRLRPLS